MVTVAFPVPCEVAFDYLVDPRNRPEWQSSLVRVEDVAGEPRVGQTWTDVTVPRVRPRMETVLLDRPHRWTETGRWRGLTASLTLDLVPTAAGCSVTATMAVDGRGPWWPLARAVALVAPLGVVRDLRHVASRFSP